MDAASSTRTVIDLFEVECPNCGKDHIIDHTGDGEKEDVAWCERCGWEGTCADLMGTAIPKEEVCDED